MRKIWIICILALLNAAAVGSAAEDDMVLIQPREASQPLNLTSSVAHNSAPTTDATSISSYIRMSGLILVVIGCCVGGVVLYFKRRSSAAASGKQSARLCIQERLSFGPNREFILLKACDRILVVAAQNGQAVLLTDMASEEAAPAVPASPIARQNEDTPLTYESMLVRATHKLDSARPRTPAPQTQIQSWPDLEGVLR